MRQNRWLSELSWFYSNDLLYLWRILWTSIAFFFCSTLWKKTGLFSPDISCWWSLAGFSPLIETIWSAWERKGPRYNPTEMDGRKTLRTELCCLREIPVSRFGLQGINTYLVLCAMLCLVLATDASLSKTCDKTCLSGKCVNGSCVCDRGWVGDQCQHCHGRFKWV